MVCLILSSCSYRGHADKSPMGYDLENAEVFQMPASLKEISGIAFHKIFPGGILAEQDEEGAVFFYDWQSGKAKKLKFGKKGDYEDITVFRSKVYVLRSDGSITAMTLKKEKGEMVISGTTEFEKILPAGEYEGLFGDERSGKLFALCKECNYDTTEGGFGGYTLSVDVAGGLVLSDRFSFTVRNVKGITDNMRSGFKPSALAINPLTREWYILSSANKMLMVAWDDMDVKAAYKLKSSDFNQPEGIAFDSQYNLYISNEGGSGEKGNIMKFTYKGQQ